MLVDYFQNSEHRILESSEKFVELGLFLGVDKIGNVYFQRFLHDFRFKSEYFYDIQCCLAEIGTKTASNKIFQK